MVLLTSRENICDPIPPLDGHSDRLSWDFARFRSYDPKQGRFLTLDSYQGNSSDPASLHKYIYANDNPIMGIDPSGRFTLAELVVNTAVSTIINYCIAPLIKPAVEFLSHAFIPAGLAELLYTQEVSSFMVGIEGSMELRAASFGAGGSIGVEALLNWRKGYAAFYGYAAYQASIGVDQGQAHLPGPYSIGFGLGVKAGLVLNAPELLDYTGPFASITLSSRLLPSRLQTALEYLILRGIENLEFLDYAQAPAAGPYAEIVRRERQLTEWSQAASRIRSGLSVSLFWTPGNMGFGSKGFSFNFSLLDGESSGITISRSHYELLNENPDWGSFINYYGSYF